MVIKQIIYDELTGKLMLHDNENNHYECNMYGDRKPSFITNVTGVANYQTRVENKCIRSLSQSKDIGYCPVTRKFEGYCQFPRSITPPFANVPLHEISDPNKRKLIKTLSKYFTKSQKAMKLFRMTNSNNGLSYSTHALNPYDSSRRDTGDIIKLIDKHFEEYRKKNKYQLNLMPKDPIIKALTRFKNVLLANTDMTVVYNKKLNSPNKLIRNKYKIVDGHIKYLSANLNKETNEMEEKVKLNTHDQPNRLKEHDELSELSIQTENDIKYMKENMIQFKSLDNLQKNCEIEKKLLAGLDEKRLPSLPKLVVPKIKLRSNGEAYDEDMKILRKSNPNAFEIRKIKDDFDFKQLVKKKDQNKIHQNNLGFKIKK